MEWDIKWIFNLIMMLQKLVKIISFSEFSK